MNKQNISVVFISVLFSLCISSLHAQTLLSDTIFGEKIKTVILQKDKADLTIPLLYLNQPEKLHLRFDELSDAVTENYRYILRHCNDDWSPSSLSASEFYSGFNDGSMHTVSFSMNTSQPYVHYELVFPDDYSQFKVSGNYVITVYPEGNPDDPVLRKQFRVVEPLTHIQTIIKPATENLKQDQEVEIGVRMEGYSLIFTQPKTDLKVYVIQNGRRDKMQLIPLYDIRGNTYNYIWNKQNIFNGGNEYRSFDIKNIRNRMLNIDQILYIGGEYHTYLSPEKDRSKDLYVKNPDINGKMKIHADFVTNPDNEGDYTWVHFSLPMKNVRLDGRFYLMGELTNWTINNASELKWNEKEKAYQNALFLKQGYYNYHIVQVPFRSMVGNETVVEGNHVETENDYHILIYCRAFGDTYDRLIGYQCFNSVVK